MLEVKVTAAAVASAIVPLVLLLSAVLGWGWLEADIREWTLAIATLLLPVVTLAGGFLKKSRTSATSDAATSASLRSALEERG